MTVDSVLNGGVADGQFGQGRTDFAGGGGDTIVDLMKPFGRRALLPGEKRIDGCAGWPRGSTECKSPVEVL